MNIEEIIAYFNILDNSLLAQEKKYIHFQSMKNFVSSYQLLPDNRVKDNVLRFLNGYLNEIRSEQFQYTIHEGYDLATKYLEYLSEVYKENLGFKSFLKFEYIISIGVVLDLGIYLFLYRHLNFWLPVVSAGLIVNYFYIKYFFEKKGKIYGIFY